ASVMAALPAAQAYYADSRKMAPDQVQKLEPFHVVVSYFWEQYELLADEQYKLVELPYPIMMERMQAVNERLAQAHRDSPRNPFLDFISSLNKAAIRYARVERQMAALMAVEAIRSYAAANGGKLPAKRGGSGKT